MRWTGRRSCEVLKRLLVTQTQFPVRLSPQLFIFLVPSLQAFLLHSSRPMRTPTPTPRTHSMPLLQIRSWNVILILYIGIMRSIKFTCIWFLLLVNIRPSKKTPTVTPHPHCDQKPSHAAQRFATGQKLIFDVTVEMYSLKTVGQEMKCIVLLLWSYFCGDCNSHMDNQMSLNTHQHEQTHCVGTPGSPTQMKVKSLTYSQL